MRNYLCLYEHEDLILSTRSSVDQTDSPNESLVLDKIDADYLKSIKGLLPKDAFRWESNRVKCLNYCGVLYLPTVMLEILPKVSADERFLPRFSQHFSGEQTQRFRQRWHILKQMLSISQGMKVHNTSSSHEGNELHPLFMHCVMQFCSDLEYALNQGGALLYQRTSAFPSIPKGKINPFHPQSLKFFPKIHSEFLHLTSNHAMNQCLKWVIHRLLGMAQLDHVEFRQRLSQYMKFYQEVSLVEPSLLWLNTCLEESPIYYKNVLRFCQWFVQGEFYRYGRVPKNVAASRSPDLLFSMPRLFEMAIATTLMPWAEHQQWQCFVQGPKKPMITELMSERKSILLRPDVTFFSLSGDPTLIIDTKWKFYKKYEKSVKALSAADAHQILSYALTYHCDRLVVIYPALLEDKSDYHFVDCKIDQNCFVRLLWVNLDSLFSVRSDREIGGEINSEIDRDPVKKWVNYWENALRSFL